MTMHPGVSGSCSWLCVQPLVSFLFFFFKIYLFYSERERETERQREKQAPRREHRHGTRSRVSRITPQAAGGTKPLYHQAAPALGFSSGLDLGS